MINFDALEKKINSILENEFVALANDSARLAHYSSLFDRRSEDGFYRTLEGPRGLGEQPTWHPNEAYMQSIEAMWQPVGALLNEHGLRASQSLRESFPSTREYQDFPAVHRRVFIGQFVQNEKPITLFMLTVPHSHEKFHYSQAPIISISKSLQN